VRPAPLGSSVLVNHRNLSQILLSLLSFVNRHRQWFHIANSRCSSMLLQRTGVPSERYLFYNWPFSTETSRRAGMDQRVNFPLNIAHFPTDSWTHSTETKHLVIHHHLFFQSVSSAHTRLSAAICVAVTTIYRFAALPTAVCSWLRKIKDCVCCIAWRARVTIVALKTQQYVPLFCC
jgi:hypothetical protein